MNASDIHKANLMPIQKGQGSETDLWSDNNRINTKSSLYDSFSADP